MLNMHNTIEDITLCNDLNVWFWQNYARNTHISNYNSIYYLDGKNVDYINTMTCISVNEKESHFIF